MPSQPTPVEMHVDRYLTDLAVSWSQDASKFVADKVFPTVPVHKQSDLYVIYDKGYFYRDEMTERPLGGKSNRTGYGISNGTYRCEEHSLAHPVDDRVRANADQPLDPDRAAMRLLTTQALIHRDRLWAADFFKTSVWGQTDQTGVASGPTGPQFLQFDQAGSDPIGVVDKAVDNMGGTTGFDPNVLVLGRDVFRILKNHTQILARIQYTQRAVVTTEILANLFGVDRVIVPGGVQNTAKEGQTNAIDFILNKKGMMLAYAAAAPSVDTPSAGYTFAWTDLIPGATNAFGGVIGRMRDEEAHSDLFEIRTAFDTVATATELGQFFAAAVA